jgi:hypothetical protein
MFMDFLLIDCDIAAGGVFRAAARVTIVQERGCDTPEGRP